MHCLNNLLQDRVFDEVKLADVGLQLDAEERRLLGGSVMSGSEGNVREDGFFNVQVIRAALQNSGFQMNLVTRTFSPSDSKTQRALICNRKEHWFALRRIGQEWFDLNSCLRTPRHLTPTELASTVAEAMQEGYAIFTVEGNFPPCELEMNASQLLEAVRGCGSSKQTHCLFTGSGNTLSSSSSPPSGITVDPALLDMAANDPELAAAIAASLQDAAPQPPPAAKGIDEMRQKRLARFG